MSNFKIVLLACLLGCFASNVFAQKANYQTAIEKLEQKRTKAQIQQNVELLADCLDETMVYIHTNGMTEDKKGHLEAIGTKKYELQQFDIFPKTYHKHKRMCVVYGDAHVKVLYKGTNIVFDSKYTAVYVKRRSGWKLASWQNTKVSNN